LQALRSRDRSKIEQLFTTEKQCFTRKNRAPRATLSPPHAKRSKMWISGALPPRGRRLLTSPAGPAGGLRRLPCRASCNVAGPRQEHSALGDLRSAAWLVSSVPMGTQQGTQQEEIIDKLRQ